jgi:hypothetical protein
MSAVPLSHPIVDRPEYIPPVWQRGQQKPRADFDKRNGACALLGVFIGLAVNLSCK